MQRKWILPWTVLVTALALPAAGAPGRYAITAERVAAAVSNSGTQISADQVTMLANVVANVADPQLKVKSIDRAGNERAIARMECAVSRQCLPFVVALRVSAEPAAAISRTASFVPARPAAPIVRSGEAAKLQLEGPHVHITLSVICLENGAAGQTIRVTTHDRHLSYRVRVMEDGTLEGRL